MGLLLLRVAIGLIMMAHGAQKLFGWFGGFGVAGMGGWLESLGFRNGPLQARLVGWSELAGGASLALGLLTPLGAAAVVGVMLVAIATVHVSKGFFNTEGGYEFNVLLAAGALALAFTGPGEISFDNALGTVSNGPVWGTFALVVATVAAASALGLRAPSMAETPTRADTTDTTEIPGPLQAAPRASADETAEVVSIDLTEEEAARG